MSDVPFPNADEQAVIDRVTADTTERLRLGREQYGPLDLSRERDLDTDIAQEAADLNVYTAWRQLRKERGL